MFLFVLDREYISVKGVFVSIHSQCHLLKQISVKKQKSAFLLPLTQIFLGSILKKLDIEKIMCGVFLIKIRKTPINQEIITILIHLIKEAHFETLRFYQSDPACCDQ